jgi:subtilisin family serine protease
MKQIVWGLLFWVSASPALPQNGVMYRLGLSGKGDSPYTLAQPEAFLSEKALARRAKQGLPLDSTDLPIAPARLQALRDAGAVVWATSKWVNTVTVSFPSDGTMDRVLKLPFVHTIAIVHPGYGEAPAPAAAVADVPLTALDSLFADSAPDYGETLPLFRINNALPLHERGFKGQGVTIAVIDAGFRDADRCPQWLNMARVAGIRNFTPQAPALFRSSESHGTLVLSCLLADAPGQLTGTAPEAAFYLLQSELNDEEYPVEEDYWVAALEYADSVGVDIVSSSLGYSSFDEAVFNHRPEELDGRTAPASRVASMAADKGMAVFLSAGNHGNNPWQTVSVPGDARNVLTVGAVRRDSLRADYSSWGTLMDGRFKPEVMALGNPYMIDPQWGVRAFSGTSFATPALAGMAACLWEALPALTATGLMTLILESSDRYDCPDAYYGYGIPNLEAAYLKGLSQGWNF